MLMSDVLDFMKGQVGRVFSVREISKEVDEDRFNRDKVWATHELKGLCNKGFIQTINGCYWIPPEEEKEEEELAKEPEKGEGGAIEGEESPAE